MRILAGTTLLSDDKRVDTIPAIAKKVALIGFSLRLMLLVFILTVGQDYSAPYFITDDKTYEYYGELYLGMAAGPIDVYAFDSIGAGGAIAPFWFWVVCVLAYLTRSVYAARFLNIALSSVVVIVVYCLTKEISNNDRAALLSARLYAYMPLSVFVSCFCIKDIFLTLAVMYLLLAFVRLQNGKALSWTNLVASVALAIATYFTRGAVVELLLIFLVVYVLDYFVKKKNYLAVIVVLLVTLGAAYFMWDALVAAFDTKLKDYSEFSSMGVAVNALQAQSVAQFYKIPFSYLFATIQPITLNLFAESTSSFWLTLITYLNLAIVPVAISNFLYIFCKKDNFVFWLSTAVMFAAVTTLVLGIFRHYLFLLPVEMINCALFFSVKARTRKQLVVLLSLAFYLLVFLYSFYVAF